MEPAIKLFADKMHHAQVPETAIHLFRHFYGLLCEGTTGLIAERDIEPLADDSLIHFEGIAEYRDTGLDALERTAAIKLNGGLGTSMGLAGPKCLLELREGLSFLDATVRQAHALRTRTGRPVPLILMNSFNTERESLEVLARYDSPSCGLPPSFVQHRFPKVMADSLSPAVWPADPSLEWNPPGHGDLFAAIQTSGMLAHLLRAGKRYLFVSNIDNLGADLDPALLGYFAAHRVPFMMEVVRRTAMHRKGGHLARHRGDGRLILREIAQTSPEDLDAFQDINRHRWFNTNNLWIDLERLDALLKQAEGVLKLPLIRNQKHLDPRDLTSPEVFQLETAMGAAIALFDGAQAVSVPGGRYTPVKKSEDLLLVRSDRFHLTDQFVLIPVPSTTADISVSLDEHFYGRYDQLEKRFPFGPPSLRNCRQLTVGGDILFGRDISVEGSAVISNTKGRQVRIEDGLVLRGDIKV